MRSAALIFSYVYNALPGKAAFENGLRSFWFFFSSCSCALQAIFQPSTMKPAAMAAPMRKKCESDHIHCLLRMFYAVYQYLRSRFRYCTASRTCSASMRSLPARSAMVRLTFSTLS